MGRKVASVCRMTFGSRSGRVWRRGHVPRRHRHGGPFAVIGASNGHVCKGFCSHHEGGAILRYVCVERRAIKDIKHGGCHPPPPPPPPFPRDTTPAELRAEREPSGASLYCLVVACLLPSLGSPLLLPQNKSNHSHLLVLSATGGDRSPSSWVLLPKQRGEKEIQDHCCSHPCDCSSYLRETQHPLLLLSCSHFLVERARETPKSTNHQCSGISALLTECSPACPSSSDHKIATPCNHEPNTPRSW